MSLTPRRIALTCAFIFRASPRYLERLTQPMCETLAACNIRGERLECLLRALRGVELRDLLIALFLTAEEQLQCRLGRVATLGEREGRLHRVRVILLQRIHPDDALRRHDLLPPPVVRIGSAVGALDRCVPHSARLEVERVRGDLAALPGGTPLGEVAGAGERVEDESPRALDDARDDDLPVRLVASFACHLHAPSAEVSSRTR